MEDEGASKIFKHPSGKYGWVVFGNYWQIESTKTYISRNSAQVSLNRFLQKLPTLRIKKNG